MFVVRDNKAVEVAVTSGRKLGELTAIDGALKAGEKAVLKPAPDFAAGAVVKIAAK